MEITKGENANLIFKHKDGCTWLTALPTGVGTWGCSCGLDKLLLELEDYELTAPTPPLDVEAAAQEINEDEITRIRTGRSRLTEKGIADILRRHIASPAPQLKLKIQELVGLPVDREIEDDLVFSAVKALHHAVGLCQHSHWGASPAQPEKRDECKCVGYLAGDRYATDTSPCSLHREVAPQSGKEGQ